MRLLSLNALCFIVGISQACASEDSNNKQNILIHKKMEYCKGIEETATKVINMRMDGISMSKILEPAIKIDDEFVRNDIIKIIEEAYNIPNYQTDEIREREISEFISRVYARCIDESDL